MRTQRIRNAVNKLLAEKGPLPTHKILEGVNERTKWGTTSHQLGNILAKYPDYQKVGHTYRSGVISGSYEVCVWDLTPHDKDISTGN